MKKQLSLVSVIVPIYNVAQYLDTCIKSILKQTYKNLEIILIDDGSVDESGKIADNYGKKYENIKVVHQKNGGLSSARNAGIKIAKGEWIAFIDSDDYIEKDFIAKLIKLAMDNDADIATCSFSPFSDDGSVLKKIPNWPSETLSGYDAINDMMANKRPAYICLNLFKSSLFKKHKIAFPVGQEFEDIATKIKLLYYARKVAFTNEQLYYYLIRKNSITGKKFSDSRYLDFNLSLKEAKDFLKESKYADKFVYLDYFELSYLLTLLNYLARDDGDNMGVYWNKIRKRIKDLYKIAKFPSSKVKIITFGVIRCSVSRRIYSALYRKVKK